MRKLALSIIAIVNLYSCNSPLSGIEGRIVDVINARCNNKECTIRIRKITNFTWDKMYVFRYNATEDEIENAVGQNLRTYTEFTRKLIFTSNNHIVHYEEHRSSVESLVNKQVVFDMADTVNYNVFTPENAMFRVFKRNFKKGVYYVLQVVE